MNNPKQQKVTWNLDNQLDLTKNNVEIDSAFSRYHIKNSPMYNASISPLYTKTDNYDNRVVYNTKGDRFHYKDGTLYMNDEPVMITDGDSYFERNEVDHSEYDCYSKKGEDELYAKLDNDGIIRYHTPTGDYEFEVSDPLSAVLDSRARFVEDGTPIIAYLLTDTRGNYEFIYLKNEQQYSKANIEYLNYSKLDLNTVSAADPTQDRASVTNNVSQMNQDTLKYIKFVNPLIQIANPLDNVYVVSFISNHGSHLKPSDVGFYIIMDNDGTFYDTVEWNTEETEVETTDNLTTSAEFQVETSHELTQQQVYCYIIPSGNPEWDALHSEDAGKWFLGYSSDGVNQYLDKEIVFDPGYDPKTDPDGGWVSNTTDYYQTGSGVDMSSTQYTKWAIYNSNSYTDKWTLKGTVQPVTKTDTTLDLTYHITPKVKTIHKGEESDKFSFKSQDIINAIQAQLPEGTEFERFEYQTVANDTVKDCKVYGLALDGQTAEESYTENIDEKWAYQAKDGSQITTKTAAAMMIEKTILDLDVTRVFYTISVLFRAKTGTTVDTKPSIYRFQWTPNDDHSQFVSEDFQTYWLTTVNTYTNTSVTPNETVQVDYKRLVYHNTISSTSAYSLPPVEIDDITYGTVISRSDYITWADGEEQEFSAQVQGTTTTQATTTDIEWTFEYTGNNIEYSPDFFFEKFNDIVHITFKTKAGYGDYETDFEDTSETATVRYDATTPVKWEKIWTWTYKFLSKQNITPNIFLDNGTAISLVDMTHVGVLPQSALLVLQVKPTAVNGAKFDYESLGYYNSGGLDVPGVIWDVSIDLNVNYFRYLVALSDKYGTTTAQGASANLIKVLYDSGYEDTILEPGVLTPDTTATGLNESHYYNLQGSLSVLRDDLWRTTINSSGLVSGLSYGNNEFIGTLLTEWNSISEEAYIYYDDDMVGYYSTDGNWYEIYKKKGDGDIRLIFDRYIIVNTDGFWNCFDITRHKPIHYASDFNNRVMPGISYKDFGSTGAYTYLLTQDYSSDVSRFFVSGINSLYEVSQVAITSLQLSPQAYLDIVTGKESFCHCKQPTRYKPQYIEVFYGVSDDATAATYQYSTIRYPQTNLTVVDSSLVDLNAPVAIAATTQYSPNIFTEFIHTYNNKDLIVNGSFSYPIMYNETTPILTYSSGKQISNVSNIFVIQSQFYGIIDDKIVSITYDNYSIIAIDAIIDISGMVYLGYLPTRAFFWSPSDRCIYTFTGDANLDITMEASKISRVDNIYYNPSTESIFITTNVGIIIIAGMQQWMIPEEVDVDSIYFIKKGYFIVVSKDGDGYRTTAYAYEKDLLEGCEKRKIEVETKFVGPGSGKIANTDNVQIILITEEDEAGQVLFQCETFTDVGFKSEEKVIDIKKGTWDKGNKAVVINYFPKYQTGQGFKWRIVSDFAISQITQSVTQKAETTLTQRNI